MAGKFVITKGRDGKFYFNLKAGNGEVILTSQGYTDKRGCENGIESVRKNGGDAKRFEIKASTDNKQYFVLKAGNGEPIGRSQMYKTESGCQNGVESVGRNCVDATVVEEIMEGA